MSFLLRDFMNETLINKYNMCLSILLKATYNNKQIQSKCP